MLLPTIYTERLLLRPFTIADVEASYQVNLDPEVTRYTNDGGVQTREQMHAIINNNVLGDYAKYGFGRFAVELKETGEFIGFSGLKFEPELDAVDLGYRFRRDQWGKGIATESAVASMRFGVDTLKLKRMVACILPANKASSNVLDKLGFMYEKEFMDDGVLVHQYDIDLSKKQPWQDLEAKQS